MAIVLNSGISAGIAVTRDNTYEEILVKSSVIRTILLYALRKKIDCAYDIFMSAKCTDTDFVVTLGKYDSAKQIWNYILNHGILYTDIKLSEISFSCVYLELMLMLRFNKDYLESVIIDKEGRHPILQQIFMFEAEIYFNQFMRNEMSADYFKKIKWFCDDPDLVADKTANMLNDSRGEEAYCPERSALFRLSPRKKTKPDYKGCYELARKLQEKHKFHIDSIEKYYPIVLSLYNIVCENSPDIFMFSHVISAVEFYVDVTGQYINHDCYPNIFSCSAAKANGQLAEEYSRLTGKQKEEDNE